MDITKLIEKYIGSLENDWLLDEEINTISDDFLFEKWAKKVKIKKTGEHAEKTVAQLKKEIKALRGTKGEAAKEQMGELLFALRAKTGWKKGKGAAGLKKSK